MWPSLRGYPQVNEALADGKEFACRQQKTWVCSLGREDPLEKEMATLSSVLAWRIPWTEEPGRLWGPWGHKDLDTIE